jgi:hypothetical protein
MGPAFVEFLLFALLLAALYRFLRPVQRRLESLIHGFLDPHHRGVTDAEIVHDEKRKKHKE